ncbi:hisS [Symbiodinium microadriaticum]|nr:hisS [Symbiodinium microadriaticum]
MGKKANNKPQRPKARAPKGFRDLSPATVQSRRQILNVISETYELYGFEPLETPSIEYVDALGKFLPDVDRPEGGVFGFEDDDGQWLALRYDLTAPLARFVAEGRDALARPYRRYQWGTVFRNEKVGPGRFREFMQCDADTVGTASMAAEAELIAMQATALEAIGLPQDDFVIRLNNRKILDGILETINVSTVEDDATRLTVLRAIDKMDRLGAGAVRELLGKGREDKSGDYTDGANLSPDQIDQVMAFVEAGAGNLATLKDLVAGSETGLAGINEIEEILSLLAIQNVNQNCAQFDPAVIRGLAYYTGPVFETELTFETLDEKGKPRRFGSVGSGGRYDGLVRRFTGQDVPATGISIGIDRLMAAVEARKLLQGNWQAPVVVTVMDRDNLSDYQAMVTELRNAGIKAELYLGTSGMKAQLKYADKRGAPIAVIQGSDERDRGEVMLKDLILGGLIAQNVDDNKAWREDQPAQVAASRADLVSAVREMLARDHSEHHA